MVQARYQLKSGFLGTFKKESPAMNRASLALSPRPEAPSRSINLSHSGPFLGSFLLEH
jgi:hypothetical protein